LRLLQDIVRGRVFVRWVSRHWLLIRGRKGMDIGWMQDGSDGYLITPLSAVHEQFQERHTLHADPNDIHTVRGDQYRHR
jgi:hypothetical protein